MRPLVVELREGAHAWIEDGMGWLCLPGGKWQPIVDAEGIGGRVLSAQEVWVLTMEIGRPS